MPGNILKSRSSSQRRACTWNAERDLAALSTIILDTGHRRSVPGVLYSQGVIQVPPNEASQSAHLTSIGVLGHLDVSAGSVFLLPLAFCLEVS
jgi:hypothetical protein